MKRGRGRPAKYKDNRERRLLYIRARPEEFEMILDHLDPDQRRQALLKAAERKE